MAHLHEPGAALVPAFIDYPESDGEPIGETDVHVGAILYLREALRYVFRQAERIYVAANMLFYYEEGDPSAVKAPDVFVVRGAEKHDRRVYKLWEERVAPCLILEVTSRKMRLEDVGTKRALYEMLGVREYVLFDPLAEYLTPRLQAFVLEAGRYRVHELGPDETFRSAELGIVLRAEGTLLRTLDPETGYPVPTLEESAEQTRLQAEQTRLQARRAEAAEAKAEAESQRAEAAEAEAEALRARLRELEGKPPHE
jgi:Uma2 family endonuclease